MPVLGLGQVIFWCVLPIVFDFFDTIGIEQGNKFTEFIRALSRHLSETSRIDKIKWYIEMKKNVLVYLVNIQNTTRYA